MWTWSTVFVKQGALSSERILAINEPVARLLHACNERGMAAVAFGDCHTPESVELQSYPPHCMCGSVECDITSEIQAAGKFTLVRKNSTNGFLEPEFASWLQQHAGIRQFLVVGDCTDICILQLALALKAHFNRQNLSSRVVVPADLVATYTGGLHNGDMLQLFSLYNLSINGVEVASSIVP